MRDQRAKFDILAGVASLDSKGDLRAHGSLSPVLRANC